MDSISTSGTPHFVLCEGERCPHLDERGLCRIILNAGEENLCNICREHPRFYNHTRVAEVGLGMACREAARLILSSPNYSDMEVVGETDDVDDDACIDGIAEREATFDILSDKTCDYEARLKRIYRKYGIDAGEDSDWIDMLDSLEYLEASHRALFAQYSSKKRPAGADVYLERALAYFIYRQCTEAYDDEDLRSRLSFCLFCERLLASLICARGASTLEEIAELASIISEELEYSDDNTEALTYCM
ncbi:MAG: hypothetical protein IKK70_06620 [Clostridia bacterium]|nr:hypothetical protein [Clostridia bacterium]